MQRFLQSNNKFKEVRIGVVLSQYPAASEAFIDSFLSHLEGHEVFLYAKGFHTPLTRKLRVKLYPYLNTYQNIVQTGRTFLIALKTIIYINRAIQLRSKGVSIKQLIADASIWTTHKLDIIYFPFANLAFGREHYASIMGAKMALSFRGSDVNVYPTYHNRSYKSIWPYVHAVQCNSVELANKLYNHNIPKSIKLSIIYPALRSDLKNITPRTCPPTVGTSDNPLIITTLGRLHWIKDYPFALRIMHTLKLYQEGLYFRYFILGDGPELEHLMFLRKELDLEEEVIFVGRGNPNNIAKQFNNTHIYLQTSLAEGFSNACLEAQAFGIPCVVPAISGMEACIEDGKTGIIVRKRDEKSFSEAIVSLSRTIDKYDPEYTAQRIKQEFTIEKQRDQWISFLKSCNNPHPNTYI